MEGRDHYINPCCFCEDLAHWLGSRLSVALSSMVAHVYQEDFGWVIDLVPHGQTYTIMVVAQAFIERDYAPTDEFGVYVGSRPPGLLRRLLSPTSTSTLIENTNLVVRTIDAELHAESGIQQILWSRDGFGIEGSKPHPEF